MRLRLARPRARPGIGAFGAILLLLCLPAWWIDRTAFLAAWLVAWSFCAGIVLGGLANVWIHNLTGGAWGEAVREPLLNLGRAMPALALLFLPILAGLGHLYPWAAGDIRWPDELSAPAFKSAWLQPGFFVLRAVVLLASWCALAWAGRRPGLARSGGFAAGALIVYGITSGIAAVDWIMSLTPVWYSSIFGLLVAVGQVLGGTALAACLAGRQAALAAGTRRDIGNFLLAYVLTWGYLAFAQFLIIWSENLPREISWYVLRRDDGWLALGLAVALFQFALPLLLLLFRAVKESPHRLRWVGLGVLGAHFLDVCWLVLPSAAGRMAVRHLPWLMPLTTLGLAAIAYSLAAPVLPPPSRETRHV